MFDLKSASPATPDWARFIILLVIRSRRFARVIFRWWRLIGETITLRLGFCLGGRRRRRQVRRERLRASRTFYQPADQIIRHAQLAPARGTRDGALHE